MIHFSMSQMGALILLENFKLSNLLISQIVGAPSKADTWHLRCEKDELLTLQKALAENFKKNEESSALGIVLEELDEICREHL
ncbi:hypothetical protein [Celerinatantimonas diazotrophica]|uniref:Uncharacterized protein n=1 Tax=Celerinatantimonas diazotrophica TaxID=412034 RepID=A0A4R1J9T5_9GAMM|nr:hypothetical protein [Celerinatantimonas diazotrophica]TCK47194.1 hypothetical protein EV690_2896 [Celerinatantimonas diazotrophica]CAG9295966.1 hypothetical protein CEDIAZO_01100 [Celerinatantimonas diazotrophica]